MAKLSMTTEEFVEKLKEIYGGKYDYTHTVYNGYDSKVKVKCNRCNEIFEIKAGYLLKGKGCPYCKYYISEEELENISKIPIDNKTKEFIVKAKEIHNSKYSYEYVRYKNLKTKVIIKCNECNRLFKQIPKDHLKGHGCPFCGKQKSGEKQRLTKEEFIKRARLIHNNKYDYSLVEYRTIRDKVKIKCNSCNTIFEQYPAYHLKGHGCPICTKGGKLSHEEFVERVMKNYGDNIEILSRYVSYRQPVSVKCKRHNNITEVKAEYLLKGAKFCRQCMLELGDFRGVKLTKDEFIKRAREIHGDNYDYSLVIYKTYNDKVKIKCNNCSKIFETYPIAHLKGSICPYCNINNMKLTKEELQNRITSLYGNDRFTVKYDSYKNISSPIIVTCNICNHEFEIAAELFLNGAGCPYCKQSSFELQIYNYLKSIGINEKQILINQRKVLDNYEIDIYLPEYKFGIECHGIFWHSLNKYNKNNWNRLKYLHKVKADLADKYGIQLLQIFEYEWNNPLKQNVWKNIIKHKLGLIKNKIYARKCKIISLSNNEAKEFLDRYHLHGYINATYNYGLVFDDEIIAVATFGKHRFSKTDNDSYELYRFATKNDIIIPGGFTKLLKHFVTKINPKKLITYADRRYSSISKNVYAKTGFIYLGLTKPNYRYLTFNQDKVNVYSRLTFQKYTLEKKLPKYNKYLTEQENLVLNDYYIIYDAGNYIFQL